MKKPILERKLPRRLTGALLAILYASAVAGVLMKLNFIANLEYMDILRITAITIGICTALFYNKYTFLTALAVALASAVWMFYTGALEFQAILDGVSGFVSEFIPMLRGGETLPGDVQHIVAVLLCVIAALFAFVTAARLAGVYTLAFTMLLLCGITRFVYGSDIFFELSCGAGVTAAIGAASYGRSRAARQSVAVDTVTGGEAAVTSGGGTSGLALFAVPIALVLILLMPLLQFPTAARALSNDFIRIRMDDVVDLVVGDNPAFTRRRTIFSLSATGFGSASELGGPVYPSDGISLYVESDSKLTYLRGTIRSVYNGRGWENDDFGGSYRFDSDMWTDLQNEVFDTGLPEGLESELYTNVDYAVSAVRHAGTLFVPSRPSALASEVENFVPYFNNRGELFPRELFNQGAAYTVSGLQQRPLNEIINQLKRAEGTASESPEKLADIKAEYLPSIPTGSSAPIYASVARELTKDMPSKIEAANTIRVWLMQYCRYTLTPQHVPANADFVDNFLTTRNGYCVYFASAMAQMARAIGIPSRYVEGYLLSGINRLGGVYTVRGTESHAWAELYFEGIGWIIFDATGMGDSLDSSAREPGDALPDDVLTIPETDITTPHTTPTASPTPGSEGEQPPQSSGGIAWWIWLLVAMALSVAALTAAAYALPVLREPTRLAARRGGASGAVQYLWRRVEAMLPHIEHRAVRESGETASHFAARLGDRVPDMGGVTLGAVAEAAMRAFYAASVEDGDLEAAYRCYAALDARLRRRFTPPVWAVLQWFVR